MSKNEETQQHVVTTLGRAVAIIRDAEMTVNGRTLEPVASAYSDLKALERSFAYGVYEVNVPSPEADDKEVPDANTDK